MNFYTVSKDTNEMVRSLRPATFSAVCYAATGFMERKIENSGLLEIYTTSARRSS